MEEQTLPATPSPNVEAMRAISNHADDPRVPLYPVDETDVGRTMVVEAADQTSVTRVASQTDWSPDQPCDEILDVYLRAAQVLPNLNIVPPVSTPDVAPFVWSRARVVFSGAGYAAWEPITRILTGLYASCPFDPKEDRQTWEDELRTAHQSCGWPVTLTWFNWRDLCAGMHDDKNTGVDQWMRVVALFHVLKHLRTRDDQWVAVCYGGSGALLRPDPSSNTLGNWARTQTNLLRALGCGSKTHPMTRAVQNVFGWLTVNQLLNQKPLTDLPQLTLSGPWSTLTPDPHHRTGFYQTGLHLDGVWLCQNQQVQPYTGDQQDVVSYAWNTYNPNQFVEAKENLEHILPQTFTAQLPADIFLGAFPNLELSHFTDVEAAKVLLELPWYADILRESNGAFCREYPLVAFMPSEPTFDGSTNQGKTMAAHTFGRVMVPGIPTTSAVDSASAPDSRAMADVLTTYGTAVLDEWSPPKSKGHILSHTNLQSLITGGTVASGRVLENAGNVAVRHSLVASSKALDMPPDMINRSLVWYLREFTQPEMDRPDTVRNLISGKVSLEIRLATIAMVEKHNMATIYPQVPSKKCGSFRFDDHATLARMLYYLRTGKQENGEIARTLAEATARLATHVQDADANGVLASLDDGGMTRVRVSSLMHGLPEATMQTVMLNLNQHHGGATGQWNTAAQLLHAVREARGLATLQSLMPMVTGRRAISSDRVIVQALTTDIRSVLQPGQSMVLGDSGYQLTRGQDRSRYLCVRLEKIVSSNQ